MSVRLPFRNGLRRWRKPAVALAAAPAAALIAGLTASLALPTTVLASLDELFGLDQVSFGEAGAELGWRFPVPLWAWVLIVLGASAFAWWTYSKLMGPRVVRVLLAGVRALLIVVIAALLAGPVIESTRERIEPNWLLMLVDQSESMTIPDMPARAGGAGAGTGSGSADGVADAAGTTSTDVSVTGQRRTRHAAVEASIRQHAALFADDALGKDRHLLWLGFDAGAYELPSPTSVALPQPTGDATALRTAIEQALQRVAGRDVAGMVIFSDGATPQHLGLDLVKRLQQRGVRVFGVPVGSDDPPLMLRIAEAAAPQRAFAGDVAPIRVMIDKYPAKADIDPSRLRVRVRDAVTGEIIDERIPDSASLAEPIELNVRSDSAGPTTWRVEVEYEDDGPVADASRLRDQRDVVIDVTDDPIRVLYIEGYPRWEYRYLVSLLLREKSIRSSIYLASADRDFAQEGDDPITRPPSTPEEMRDYDVILLGDVPPDLLSGDEMDMLRDHVALRGAGLIWIGGAQYTPRSYAGGRLSGLLPMRQPELVDRYPGLAGAIELRPTSLAETLSVMRLRSTFDDPNDGAGWPTTLPALQWAQQLGPLKPLVETLATGAFEQEETAGPLVTTMRYGAGQTLYVATDETWRWRYARGGVYFEQFWTQLIRMLGRHRLHQTGQRAMLRVSQRRAEIDEAIVVRLTLEDPLLIRRDLPRVQASVTRATAEDLAGGNGSDSTSDIAEAGDEGELESIELLPVRDDRSSSSAPETSDDGARTFEAIWRPVASGQLMLTITEPALADLHIRQPIEIIRPDDELRQPEPDPARLAQLSTQSGGRVLKLDELDALTDLVRQPQREADVIREDLWNTYFALIVVLVLLAIEWIGRKVIRLV